MVAAAMEAKEAEGGGRGGVSGGGAASRVATYNLTAHITATCIQNIQRRSRHHGRSPARQKRLDELSAPLRPQQVVQGEMELQNSWEERRGGRRRSSARSEGRREVVEPFATRGLAWTVQQITARGAVGASQAPHS